jgi:hypothetical protein
VSIGFNAPSTPGEIPPAAFAFVTTQKADPGPFGAGHNNQLVLSARTRLKAPSFAPSPNQFEPKRNLPGENVRLHGTNFDQRPVSVRFGTVPATILSGTATDIIATIPDMPAGAVKITVQTGAGSAVSDDEFRVVPVPVIVELDPSSGRPGDTFRVIGADLTTEGAGCSVDFDGPFGSAGAPIVGSPTATRVTARIPDLREASYVIRVLRDDGAEAVSDESFRITLL